MTSFRARSLQLSGRIYAIAGVLGTALALAVTLVINKFEARHAIVLFAGVIALSVALALGRRLPEILLYLLGLLLPFTSIEKSFFVTSDTTFVVSGIAIGPIDLVLAALYALWCGRVVVARSAPRPRLSTLDYAVIIFIGVHALSVLKSVSPVLSIYETIRLTKYALLFFYLEHNVTRRDLMPLVAGLCLSIVLQSGLGVVQQRTGKLLGIGRTKGADMSYEQYTVTGFESVRRAEGTTFDSHALALFFAMTLAVPFGLALTGGLRPIWRLALALTFAIGTQGLVVSFARAGWVAFALGLCVLLGYLVRWREWGTLRFVAVLVFALAIPASIPFAGQIRQRIFEAPPELVTARIETIEMGLQMFRTNPLTGVGANAYMRALELQFSIFEGDPYFIPAHNMYVFVLTEIGVIGAAAFLCLVVAVLHRLMQGTRTPDRLLRTLAVTILCGFVAFLMQGLSDPIYATNVTYFLLWFLIGLGAAVARIGAASPAPAQPVVVR